MPLVLCRPSWLAVLLYSGFGLEQIQPSLTMNPIHACNAAKPLPSFAQ